MSQSGIAQFIDCERKLGERKEVRFRLEWQLGAVAGGWISSTVSWSLPNVWMAICRLPVVSPLARRVTDEISETLSARSWNNPSSSRFTASRSVERDSGLMICHGAAGA